MFNFRTKTGIEVDLIISCEEKKIAIEIKSTSKIQKTDYKNLHKLMELDHDIDFGIIVSFQSAPFKLAEKIFNVPIWCL